MEPLVILLAFVAGLGFRALGYPPLLGYLLAGFVAHALGLGQGQAVGTIADLGITLLLFTIGLKLNLRELIAPQVWGTATLQMIAVVPLTWLALTGAGLLIPSLALPSPEAGLTLAFALSFSSTVFTTKTFEERGEAVAIHAAIAIGILIIQDLFAVTYLVAASGKFPSVYALALVALPLLRPLLGRLLVSVGHGELLVLFGFVVALGGAGLFEAVNLKGDLGALVIGMLLNSHDKSTELYKNLIQFKDIFLIGFFLQIGFNGLPGGEMLLVAFMLGALIVLRPVVYLCLLIWLRQRARTSLLAALSLATYSEFGLIVAQLATKEGIIDSAWVTTIALALAISFFVATPLNNRARDIYARFSGKLQGWERGPRSTEESVNTLSDADIVIVGAGRVGTGAYRYLDERYPGNVVCIEENKDKVAGLMAEGINCVHGDGNDRDFWQLASLPARKLILVSLTNHRENMGVVKLLQNERFKGQLAVVSRYADEEQEIREAGCITFNLYAEAGHGFAEHVLTQIQPAN
ncbi:cation:proton antiporter [Litorivivens sp.]|uniref:cation:proton antiporter domain-containing protein n=1 Tax=Litorivivens sp. TaxID=2020868 RepID=UPI00356AB1B9